jgi:tRNA-splicing ligase RtcB (3'-phosphate/5'-hydroxy nucleic acid ligase)
LAKGEKGKPGKISREEMVNWLNKKEVIRFGGGVDEAPQAYRRLTDVLDAHKETVIIRHTLKPKLVIMAGEREVDPYKD